MKRSELAAVLVFYNVQHGAAADLPAGRQVEKLMMKITTKAVRIPPAGYGLIAIKG